MAGIDEQDKWAIRRLVLLISRIRYDDHGYGVIRIILEDGAINLVEQTSYFKAKDLTRDKR